MGERRAATIGGRRLEARPARAHARAARLRRAWRARRSPAGAALGRRDAARRHRPRTGEPAAAAARRRADRRARSRYRGTNRGAPRPRQRGRHGARPRHARPGARRALAPHPVDARRPHRAGGRAMIGRLALRSLTAHPIRSAVLAAGFGVGVAVMAILLGVAEIVLDQAQAPALVGGGDVVIRLAPEVPARLLLTGTLQADALRDRVRVAAPSHTTRLYLVRDGRTVPVSARGGIPSLERALADQEILESAVWRDTPEDIAWTQDTPERVLRYIDRFQDRQSVG